MNVHSHGVHGADNQCNVMAAASSEGLAHQNFSIFQVKDFKKSRICRTKLF